MTKIMTDEIKEASIGNFIVAEDLLNSPIKLRIVGSELKKDDVTAQSGKIMDKVVFFFEDNKGNTKEISDLSFGSLVKAMNAADPDVGDVLQLETVHPEGAKYPTWKIEIVRKGTENIPAKKVDTGEVVKEKLPTETNKKGGLSKEEEEEILNEIPF